MSDPVGRALTRITRAAGVQGAVVVDAEAGVAVASELAPGVVETALAAMAGSLFRRTSDASRTSGFGGVRLLQLDAADGHVLVAGAGSLLVVALTESGAQLGLVRVEAARAAGELRG
ncbi:MAG: roadblock/LC7 domain-containing protein [Longimicrobiales bacterium]|nr:roadblock/LC7 domain-containing protein [Longimicrobiales bacterium]